MADIRNDVAELYVAFFGRPGEPAGAQYWNDFIADELNAGRSIDQVEQEIAARFSDAGEATDRYSFLDDPANGDVATFVTDVYQNLFDRDPESGGLDFWQGRFQDMLDAGTPVEQAASRFVIEILNAAQNDDASAIANKTSIADSYSERFIETGATFTPADDLNDAVDLVDGVGSGDASLQQGQTRLDEIIDANTTANGLVTDGYVAGATVFADQDGDGVQDPGEPTTTTDDQGHFTFTDADGNEIAVGGRVVARGGTDITTGLPFQGTLTAPDGAETVSPLTSLVSQVQQQSGGSAADAQTQVKRALGLDENVDLNTYDPIATLNDPDASDADRAAALRVQSATTQVVNLSSLAGNASGGATGNADQGAGNDQALSAIADAISQAGTGGTVDLSDQNTISNIVRNALTRAQQSSGQSLDDDQVDNIVNSVSQIAQNANQRVRETAEQGGDAGAAFNQMARVQKVAQGEGSNSVRQGAQNNNFDEATQNFTGDNLDNAVNNTDVEETPGGGDDDDGGSGPTGPVAPEAPEASQAQQFIEIWKELDAAYVDIPVEANTGGDYRSDTQVSTAGRFDATLDAYSGIEVGGVNFDDVLNSTEAEDGQLGFVVNWLFVQLGNDYVEYIEDGNAAITNLAKVDSDRAQTYHDNLLGNLGDGPVGNRITGEGVDGVDTDAIDDPRSETAKEYGTRPYARGDNPPDDDEMQVAAWDLARGIDRPDADDLLDGTVQVVHTDGSGNLTGVTSYSNIQDATDIQAAIDATSTEDGDYVVVGDGEYGGGVTVDKDITLMSADGPEGVTLVGPGTNQQAAIKVTSEGSDATIGGDGHGFTLQAGDGDLAGLYAQQGVSGLTVEGNVIEGGSAHALLAGGSFNDGTITGNTLRGEGPASVAYFNGAQSLGQANASSNLTFTNNSVYGGSDQSGLLLGVEAADSTIEGNTFGGEQSYAMLELWGTGASVEDNVFAAQGSGDPILDSATAYDETALLNQNASATGVARVDGTDYDSLQEALGNAESGDTITLSGRFSENVTIDNSLSDITLLGTGNNTVLDGAALGQSGSRGDGITVAANDVTLQNLTVTNYDNGVVVDDSNAGGDNAVSGLALQNVDLVNNIYQDGSGGSYGGAGFVLEQSQALDGLTVRNSSFDGNTYGFSASDGAGDLSGVNVQNTSFDNNANKGFFARTIMDGNFVNVTAKNSGTITDSEELPVGTSNNGGFEINMETPNTGNININNLEVIGSGYDVITDGAARGSAVFLGDDYGTGELSNVTVTNATIEAGGVAALGIGGGNDVSNITVRNSEISGPEGIVIFDSFSDISLTGNTVNTELTPGTSATAGRYGIGVFGTSDGSGVTASGNTVFTIGETEWATSDSAFTLFGDQDNNVALTTGPQTVNLGGGDDDVIGAAGDDTLIGGPGADTYRWAENDGSDTVSLQGDDGGDVVKISGGPYSDAVFARDGDDLLVGPAVDFNYDFTNAGGVRITDHFGDANGLEYFEINTEFDSFYSQDGSITRIYTPTGTSGEDQGPWTEAVFGTNADDTLDGGGGYRDYLYAFDGQDVLNGTDGTRNHLRGGSGNDELNGADGFDNLRGGAGDDILNGGTGGPDVADYRFFGGSTGVEVDLSIQGSGNSQNTVAQGTDTLIDIESVRGSFNDDVLSGNSGDNYLRGEAGDDIIDLVDGGQDIVRYDIGSDGNDTIRNFQGDTDGSHNDTFGNSGGSLTGGADILEFSGVNDFTSLANEIDSIEFNANGSDYTNEGFTGGADLQVDVTATFDSGGSIVFQDLLKEGDDLSGLPNGVDLSDNAGYTQPGGDDALNNGESVTITGISASELEGLFGDSIMFA